MQLITQKTMSLFWIGALLFAAQLLTPPLSRAAPVAESPALIEKAKAVYKTNCLICHGEKGDGNGPAGVALKPKPRNFMIDPFKGSDGKGKITNPTAEQVYATIQSGVKGTTMTAYAHLAEDQKWGLAYYILQMRKEKK